MLFQAMVIFWPILNFFQISCKGGKVHYSTSDAQKECDHNKKVTLVKRDSLKIVGTISDKTLWRKYEDNVQVFAPAHGSFQC